MPRPALHNRRPTTGPSPKPRVDIGGLAGASDWRDLKSVVLARPQGGEGVWRPGGKFKLIRPGRCERCGLRPATDCHHRKLTAQGGPDAASNLAAICRECHDWCHAHPKDAQLSGFILPPQGDPRVRALLLWDGSLVLIDDQGDYSFQGWPDGSAAL
jgi:hypothetical protein